MEQLPEPFGAKDPLLDCGDHRVIDVGEAEVPERAGIGRLGALRLAGEVAVAAALAGHEEEAGAASRLAAAADLAEERRAVHPPRCRDLRPIDGEPGLDGLEERALDDRRAGDADPLLGRPDPAGPAVADIVEMLADVSRALEDVGDGRGQEPLAAQPHALAVEAGGDGLEPLRP
nr:hypothetical protein [Thermaurantiacus tibetensis]